MIIRTIDDVFVNLNNITRIKFKVDSSEQILIEHPIKEEGEDFYTVDFPLADMYINSEGLLEIRDMFIEALKRNEPYFDFREAYLRTCDSSSEMIEVAETISRLYDGKRN